MRPASPPRVSILVPTHNRAGYLREAVRSALAQSCRDFEILVLDDASTDETPPVCAELAADDRVRIVRHATNQGIVRNWRAGFEHARGEFVCLLHDDDTLEPDFVTSLLGPMLADDGLVLAFCDQWVMDDSGGRLPSLSDETTRRFKRDRLPPGRLLDFAAAALVDVSMPVGASLIRRALIGPACFDARAQGSIDAWLLYQCVLTGFGAYYLPRRLMNYRVHGGGMSGSRPLYMAEGHRFRYEQILADTRMTRLHPAIRARLAETLTDYGIGLLALDRYSAARRSLMDALRLRPGRRALVGWALACAGAAGARCVRRVRAIRHAHA